MRDDFPHLDADGANVFPDNAEPRPYIQYRNEFDYTKWDEGSVVWLLSVDWDGVRDNPWFESLESRDKWFSDNADVSVTLTVSANMRGDDIKLPIPYDVAQQYNYLVVTLPAYPVARENDNGTRTFCFYIDHSDYSAPNTTVFHLDVDWWTTYVNKVDISAVMLAQGHWAIAHSANVDDYLDNPIGHTVNLLDSEGDSVQFGRVSDIARDMANTGETVLVFDMGGNTIETDSFTESDVTYYPISNDHWDSVGGGACTTNEEWRYSRPRARQGNRELDYSYPGENSNGVYAQGDFIRPDMLSYEYYNPADTGIPETMSKSLTVNDVNMTFANHLNGFNNTLAGNFYMTNNFDYAAYDAFPNGFWQCVKAVYIMPRRYLAYDAAAIEFHGVTFHRLTNCLSASSRIKLSADDFAYPDEAKGYTKLYTSQYSQIEMTGENGNTIVLPPETLSSATAAHSKMQLSTDGARLLYYLDGVGTESAYTYQIDRLKSSDFSGAGNWQKTLMEFDIPAYSVWQTARDNAYYNKVPSRENAVMGARVARDNALEGGAANVWTSNAAAWQSCQNALNTNQTTYDNSLDTAKANAINAVASAEAANANTQATAYTNENNVANSVAASKQNMTDTVTLSTNTFKVSKNAAEDVLHNNFLNQMNVAGIAPVDGDTYGLADKGSITGETAGSTAWKMVRDTYLDYNKFTAMNDLAVQQAIDGVGAATINSVVGNTVSGVQSGAAGYVEGYNSIGSHASAAERGISGGINAAGSIVGGVFNVGVAAIGASLSMGLEVSKISGTEDIQRDYVYGPNNKISYTGGGDGKLNVEISRLLTANYYERKNNQDNFDTQYNAQNKNLTSANTTNTGINNRSCDVQTQNAGSMRGLASANGELSRSISVRNAQRSRDLAIGGSAPEQVYHTNEYNKGVESTAHSVTEAAWNYDEGTLLKNKKNADSIAESDWLRSYYNTNDTYRWVTEPNALYTAWNGETGVRAQWLEDNRQPAMQFGADTSAANDMDSAPYGVAYRVNRALDGDIMRVADRFRRYGYVCHRFIEKPALYEKWDETHSYEYWRCDEVWIKASRNAPQRAVSMIKSCLVNGITIISMEA